MVRCFVALMLVTLSFTSASLARAQGAPDEYSGDWVCQTFQPGYSVVPPHADLSQPQTNRVTTPSTGQILKFSLRSDGTYSAPAATGRYEFDAATKTLTWLDGPHKSALTQTRLGRRDNGAPKMEFVSNKRRYGCFIAKPRR